MFSAITRSHRNTAGSSQAQQQIDSQKTEKPAKKPNLFMRFMFNSYKEEPINHTDPNKPPGGYLRYHLNPSSTTGPKSRSHRVEYPIVTDVNGNKILGSPYIPQDAAVNQNTFEPRNSSCLSERNIIILSTAVFLGMGLYLLS